MKNQPVWAHSTGMLKGLVFQFAEGRWTEEIGSGIAVNEEAFDLIVPFLFKFCEGWTELDRYGVYEMSSKERCSLADALKHAADEYRISGSSAIVAELFEALADWLNKYADPKLVVSVLGI